MIDQNERKQMILHLYNLIKNSVLSKSYSEDKIKEAALKSEKKVFSISKNKLEYYKLMNAKFEKVSNLGLQGNTFNNRTVDGNKIDNQSNPNLNYNKQDLDNTNCEYDSSRNAHLHSKSVNYNNLSYSYEHTTRNVINNPEPLFIRQNQSLHNFNNLSDTMKNEDAKEFGSYGNFINHNNFYNAKNNLYRNNVEQNKATNYGEWNKINSLSNPSTYNTSHDTYNSMPSRMYEKKTTTPFYNFSHFIGNGHSATNNIVRENSTLSATENTIMRNNYHSNFTTNSNTTQKLDTNENFVQDNSFGSFYKSNLIQDEPNAQNINYSVLDNGMRSERLHNYNNTMDGKQNNQYYVDQMSQSYHFEQKRSSKKEEAGVTNLVNNNSKFMSQNMHEKTKRSCSMYNDTEKSPKSVNYIYKKSSYYSTKDLGGQEQKTEKLSIDNLDQITPKTSNNIHPSHNTNYEVKNRHQSNMQTIEEQTLNNANIYDISYLEKVMQTLPRKQLKKDDAQILIKSMQDNKSVLIESIDAIKINKKLSKKFIEACRKLNLQRLLIPYNFYFVTWREADELIDYIKQSLLETKKYAKKDEKKIINYNSTLNTIISVFASKKNQNKDWVFDLRDRSM